MEFILDCLCNRLSKSDIGLIDEQRWADILELTKKKNISALILYNLKKQNLFIYLPPSIQDLLENDYYAVLGQNIQALEELSVVLKALSEHNLKVIILKGVFIITAVYDNVALRPMTDMDMLMHQKDSTLIKKIFSELGYNLIEDNQNNSLTFMKQDYRPIEVHWDTLSFNKYKGIIRINESEFWDGTLEFKIGTDTFLALSIEDNILYLCIHLCLNHFFSNIIWLYDIKLILETYRQKIDWDKLLKKAETSGIGPAVYYCLYWSQTLLDANIETDTLKRLRPSFLRRVFLDYFSKKAFIIDDFESHYISHICQLLMIERLPDVFRMSLRILLTRLKGLKKSFN